MAGVNSSSYGFSEFDTRRPSKQEGNPEKGKNKDKSSILIQSAIHNAKGYKQAVLVVSSFGKSNAQSSAYVDYMTQENNTPLFDKDGAKIDHEQGLDNIKSWVEDTKKRKGTNRYTLHLILQSEPSANEEKAKNGMEDFLKKEFRKNDYMYVLHTDKESPHVHATIKMQGEDKKKIQATKSDLRRWRDSYAKSMREHGFFYTATSRASRGKVGKALSPSSKIKFGFYNKQVLESTERKHDQENINKWKGAYKKIGDKLSKSNSKELKDTGTLINDYSNQIEFEK